MSLSSLGNFSRGRPDFVIISTLIVCAAGSGLGLFGFAFPAFVAAVIAGIGLIVLAGRSPAGYASLTGIFVFFFLAYGLLAPAGALVGLVVLFPPPYETAQFVAHYLLACAGLSLGIAHWSERERSVASTTQPTIPNVDAILIVSFVCAGLATAFEVINVVRAGGAEILLSGKLAYQTEVTNLTGTLQAEYAARAAVGLFALWYVVSCSTKPQVPIKTLLGFAILIAPVLMSYLVLGRRTEILALLLCSVVAATYLKPINRLTLRLTTTILIVYVAFIIIFVLRETVFHHTDGSMSTDRFVAAFLHALFPAQGEFGAPFSVFSEGIKRFTDNPLLWGRSYLDGFALVVPSFLYPGEKPVQLDTQIFALASPGAATQLGTVAGFGYSPILEALINFGKLGVFMVFLTVGSCLTWLDKLRLRCGAFAFVLLYLLVLPTVQLFHRSTFGNAILSPGLWIFISVVGASVIYKVTVRFLQPRRAGHS